MMSLDRIFRTHAVQPTTLIVSGIALGVAALVACSSDDASSPSVATVPFAVTPAALPVLDLVGTSSPGDVWTFAHLTGDQYRLAGDRGTPADASDDLVIEGTLGSLGTIPGNQNEDANGIFIFRPTGAGPNEGTQIVRLPGFGYVLTLNPGAGQDPIHVVAIDKAPCVIPPKADYRPFEIAIGPRPDSFRFPSVGTFASAAFHFAPNSSAAASEYWDLIGPSCNANGDLKFTSISTPFSRQTNPQYAVIAPPVADVVGRYAPGGAVILDYGKGFGGSVSIPVANALPRSEDEVTTLAPLYRNRLFAGYFTATAVFQPTGAVRSDPTVARITKSRTLVASLGTTDGQLANLSLRSLTGEPVAPGTSASFELTTLNAEQGGAALLVNSRNGGVNDLGLGGPIIREPGSRTISLVLTGAASGNSNAFLDAITPAVPSGQELYQTLYVAYLTLVPPRSCEAPTLTWPSDVRQAFLAPLDRTTPATQHVKVTAGATGVSASKDDGTGEQPLESTPAVPVNGVQITPGTRLSLDQPAANHVWRLFCGPDFLWRPGARQDGELTRGYSSDEPGFGLVENGTYVLEHGVSVDAGTVDPNAQHFVVHVCPATGCQR